MEQENNKDFVHYAEMDETTFWKLIDESRTYSSEINDWFDRLGDLLRKLSPKQIVGFRLTMDRLRSGLKYSIISYLDFDGLPEDQRPSGYAIECFIISMGRERYYSIKDRVSEFFNPSNDTWALESVYRYEKFDQSSEIFQEKTGENPDKYIEAYHRLEELEQNKEQDNDQEMEQ
ncbi:DUF4240 domain-containing protein [Muricauda sp. SCSIO 64092]|uniref:DUF4240 domain-containing protein n=1 Tax=Allomuricauda sp. SCSIO 64092 TaxID=2908842 RepID=UPI001FF48AB2|nr:DUF4240 domain-containing protein [Muricauda sp. SCSIO 64092]UOY05021.1 DUF4240 domain-containing protein [Muricauda sp. SCSIO 64092]